MRLNHRSQVKLPEIGSVEGVGTKRVFDQIMRLLYETFKNIYDDLVNLSVGRDSVLPTASEDYLGKFFLVTHVAAVDTLHICIFDGSGSTYVWKQVTLT